MELWIRSQKNNRIRPILIKVESLELGDDLEGMDCIVANNLYNLGTYETKERTLEVLNEIENLLNPKYLIRIGSDAQKIADFLNTGDAYFKTEGNGNIKNINNTFVYRMPEK